MLPVGFEPTISAGERPKTYALTTLTEVFPCFSSVVRQMPGLNSQSRGTDRISSEFCLLCCACLCVMLLSLCCSVVIMLYCYCVVLLLFVLSYVLIVCTVPLPQGVNPIAVDKYINRQHGHRSRLIFLNFIKFHLTNSSVLLYIANGLKAKHNTQSAAVFLFHIRPPPPKKE